MIGVELHKSLPLVLFEPKDKLCSARIAEARQSQHVILTRNREIEPKPAVHCSRINDRC